MEKRTTSLDLDRTGDLSEATQAYFDKCLEKLGRAELYR